MTNISLEYDHYLIYPFDRKLEREKKPPFGVLRDTVLLKSETERYSLRSYRFVSLYEIGYQRVKN
jgi:hypothetical protein